ncbi:peptidylprolyl isomerase [Rhodobacteraceae bacterium WD3A24]|nr:peptidylprolyl isomerase [Rhodobacteraceae bacterium WD3A24]
MAKTKGKPANIAVWIIIALLIVGLAGFGANQFGGTINRLGSVGEREITVQEYANALQQEMRALGEQVGQNISFEQAQRFGLDRQVRNRLVTQAALENEAMRLGISAGDELLAEELRSMQAFQNVSGEFSRDTYRLVLEQQGMTEAEFERRMRLDIARGLLESAIAAGLRGPETAVETVFDYAAQRRSFSVFTFAADTLDEPLPEPDETELRAHYEDNIDAFTTPASREITYAWLTPSMLSDEVELDEAALRELYESRSNEFQRPERRLVERLVFPSEEAAQQARARLDAGEADFADLVEERGLEMADADMGDIGRDDLSDAAAEAVFGTEGPGVVGPVETALGQALFRVNAVLAAQETSFEEARDELRQELALQRAQRMIAERIDSFEDILASGARIESLAEETAMEFGEISFHEGVREGIAGYTAFRQAAGEVSADDFPRIRELEDGGVFALRLDEERAPQPRPFEEVRNEVAESWAQAERLARLTDRAEALATEIAQGTPDDALEPVPQRVEPVTRSDSVPGTPQPAVEAAFALEDAGATRIVTADAAVHVVRLDEILPPAEDSDSVQQQRQQIARRMAQGLSQDVYNYFADAVRGEAGISLDQAAIDAVHAQFR